MKDISGGEKSGIHKGGERQFGESRHGKWQREEFYLPLWRERKKQVAERRVLNATLARVEVESGRERSSKGHFGSNGR